MLKKSIIVFLFMLNSAAVQVFCANLVDAENYIDGNDSFKVELINKYYALDFYRNERKLIVWKTVDKSYSFGFEKVLAYNFDAMKSVLFVLTENKIFNIAIDGNSFYFVDFDDHETVNNVEFYRSMFKDFILSDNDKTYDNFINFWAHEKKYSKELAKTKERAAFRSIQQCEQNAYKNAIQDLPKPFSWKR